jgi:hypothetical protein
MENRLTAVEIINETVEFYSADVTRRSVENGYCAYAGTKGRKCAYARCWRDGVWTPEYEGKGPCSPQIPVPDALVEERYRGHSPFFWSSLQRLHDVPNWNETGLNEAGVLYVEKLKSDVSNGCYE